MKKRTIAQTAAPNKDKIKGSSINRVGSAKKENSSSIVLSDRTIKVLQDKLKEFKEKHPNNKNITLNDLKAVYRRGSGAYSTSHRPNITRAAWSYARVNKFLEKASGNKVKKAYVQDDDLLKYQQGGILDESELQINKANELRDALVKEGFKVSNPIHSKTNLAPNGKPSNLNDLQYKLVRTPAFKRWFGDWENDPKNASKVIDANGEPLVVYKMPSQELVKNPTYNYDSKIAGILVSINWTSDKLSFFKKNYSTANIGDKIYSLKNKKKGIIVEIDENDDFVILYEDGIKEKHLTYDFDIFENIEMLQYLLFCCKVLLKQSDGEDEQNLIKDIQEIKRKLKYDELIISAFLNIRIMGGFNEFLSHTFGMKKDSGVKQGHLYTVYRSIQIKIADGSNRTFDPYNPDIRYEHGGKVKTYWYKGLFKTNYFANTDIFEKGGIVVGKSHQESDFNGTGEKFKVKSTNEIVELEGGEGVIVSKALNTREKYNFNGSKKTPREIASFLNHKYGGVKFDKGGEVTCKCSKKKYYHGGELPSAIVDKLEGGEAVITKKTMQSKDKYEYQGKMLTPRQILSDINSKFGGRKF